MANGEWRMGALACEAAEAVSGIAVVVAEDPDADRVDADVVEEVVGEAVQVATAKAGCVVVEEAWVGDGFFQADLKLSKEVICQGFGDGFVPLQDFIQIQLDAAVELSGHDALDRRRVDQR